MKVYGKIYKIYKQDRLISIMINDKLEYFHMSNRNMKDFKAYLYKKPYVFLNISDEKTICNNVSCYEILYFMKIVLPSNRHGNKVYYDLNMIKRGVKSLINKPQSKIFLDLEFSITSFGDNSSSEIIEYGIIVEDENGKIVLEDKSLVKPKDKNCLNNRTLKFLSLDIKDFDNACDYKVFYDILKEAIEKYDAKIIAWGKNDILALEKSFKTNRVKPLDIRNRYMNLMQIIKNYYNYKQEKGLFNTYEEMTNIVMDEQKHDAFEDAFIAKEIYYIFKQNINSETED